MRKEIRRIAELILLAGAFLLYFFILKNEFHKAVTLFLAGAGIIFITLYYIFSNPGLSKKEVYSELMEAGVIALFSGCVFYVTFYL